MLFYKCLEAMSLLCDSNQKDQSDKEDNKEQDVQTDKKSMSDVKRQEGTKVAANLPSISFILKDLTNGRGKLDKSQDSYVENCPECQTTKEEYKINIKYVSLLEKIIHSVIQKEVSGLLEDIHEDDDESTLQETQNSTIIQGKKTQQKCFVSSPEKHSLRCLLIRLQRVLGELILQICFSLSRKTKSEKLNRLSKLNMTDITLSDLRTLSYQFSGLTDHITYMFKDSRNLRGRKNTKKMEISNEKIISLKHKVISSIDMIDSILNSVKKIYLKQHKTKPFCKMADGKCCSRIYPHVHCNINGNNFVIKYVKPKENKQNAIQTELEKSKANYGRDSPLQDSGLTKSSALHVSANSLTSLSAHILQDKLLTIIKDSAELQKKVDETSENRNVVSGNEGSRTNGIRTQNTEKNKSSAIESRSFVGTKSTSIRELEKAVDNIILDACNKYSSSHAEWKHIPKDSERGLSSSTDDTKATSLQKEYFINQAYLSYGLPSNLSRGNVENNKCEMSDPSNLKDLLIKRNKSEHLLEPYISKSRDYLPYSVSIESLPLSPEELKELSFKATNNESSTAENYEYKNLAVNRIFDMNIRHLSDLINDDRCERNPNAITNPNTAPYSPSLTSLPLTNEELEELVVKLNKSKSENIDQRNNTHMQVMYFETKVNHSFVLKKCKSLSYGVNKRTNKCPSTVINTAINVDTEQSKESDRINLKSDNLSCSTPPSLETNKTCEEKRNKSIELCKSNSSLSSDAGEEIKNPLQRESLRSESSTDLEIMNDSNQKIKTSNYNLDKFKVNNARLSHPKGNSIIDVDSMSEYNRFDTSTEKKHNTRILSRDMRTMPVEIDVNRLDTKSVNINKSKHKINNHEHISRKRQQKPIMNTNVVNNKNRHPTNRQHDKTKGRHVTIHYSSNTCQYAVLKVISLKPQNCSVFDKREIQLVLYKRLLNKEHQHNKYFKLNDIAHSKMMYPKSVRQNYSEMILIYPVEFNIAQIATVQHMKTIHTVRYEEYKNNLYFNTEKEATLLGDLKIKAKHAGLSHVKKRSFKKLRKLSRKKPVLMKNWSGDTRHLGQYSFSEIDLTNLESKLSHYMYITLDECINLLNNNIKYKKKQKRDLMFKGIRSKESAQEFLNDISIFLKSEEPIIVHKKEVLNRVFNTYNTISDKKSDQTLKEKVQNCNTPTRTSFHDIHKYPLYLFDVLGRPLTDDSGHVLKTRKGEPLLKYNDSGNPISDMFGGPVFDLKGLRPSECDFNATRTPYKSKNTALININREPLKIYDCNGRPLTSADGTPLANSSGEIMLKFDSQGQPISDIANKPIYISNRS